MVPGGAEKLFAALALRAVASSPISRPCLALSLPAADGGAYVIAELRMSGYKNNRLCWLPENLIARQVKSHLQ